MNLDLFVTAGRQPRAVCIDFEKQLNARHRGEYLPCLDKIYKFENKYKDRSGQYFREQLASKFPDKEVENVEECRLTCKAYWEDVFLMFDHCSNFADQKLAQWGNKHRRFVDAVKPLEVFADGGDKDYVYSKHKKFE